MLVGLEGIFTKLLCFLLKTFVNLSDVGMGENCCQSSMDFKDQGIILYYFIHIIFYKLLPRYILMFFVYGSV